MSGVDVVTAEIVRNGFTSAAHEMGRTLCRTAYNPLLYDVQDYGLGIVSAEGRLWAEAPGVTLFVGVLSDTIKTGLDRHGADGFADGDVLIANDPYLTGTHISDTSVYTPIFADGQLVAFAVATAHWADIGGKVPGGWCPDSTDVYQEGICFSHEKLVAGGVPNDALWSVIMNNVRYPTTVRGDLEAKIAACRQGALRVQALCAKHGVERVREAMDLSIERTDAAIRRRIAELPDGTYGAQLVMDHDGVNKADHYTLALQITVAGDRIRVSFDGTSRTVGGPVNIPAMGTRSAVRAALKGFLSPTEPANEGDFLALDFDLPPGLVVTPERPAPVDSYGYAAVALNELTVRALSQAVPERCPAGGGQLFGVFLFRVDPRDGAPFILIDPMDVGNGGRPYEDGPTMMFLGNGDVPNTPVEVAENRYPDVRVARFGYLPENGGHGRFRGGLGARRDYEIVGNGVYMQTAIENVHDPIAKGVGGGTDGAPSVIVVNPGTDRESRVVERASFFGPLGPGDVLSVRSGGGGGWGAPREREAERVRDDVRDGLVSADTAARVYGVAVVGRDGGWAVDEAETGRLRAG
ncbi:MAG: hydantoinase B/oxoprolinase family protein [Thermoleophilia bacterium]